MKRPDKFEQGQIWRTVVSDRYLLVIKEVNGNELRWLPLSVDAGLYSNFCYSKEWSSIDETNTNIEYVGMFPDLRKILNGK